MLPGRSGLDVLKIVRADGSTPIILVTARAEETDQIIGLELGADDYVVKPFRPRAVMARVRAVLRRVRSAVDGVERPLCVGPLEMDRRAVMARANGQVLTLTPTEFRLLAHLAGAPGRAFTREELLAAALPESEALERVVDAHLASVRRKLEEAHAGGLLPTVRGVGYRLEAGSRGSGGLWGHGVEQLDVVPPHHTANEEEHHSMRLEKPLSPEVRLPTPRYAASEQCRGVEGGRATPPHSAVPSPA